jgi:hypothetical protein
MRLREIFFALVLLCAPSLAVAGPKEDALATFNTFLTLFTAADADKVTALFAPDAHFYGTGSVDLVTKPEGVKAYFVNAFGTPPRPAGQVVAKLISAEATPISDTAVIVSGKWAVDRPGMPGAPLRVSMLVVKRGDRWTVVQFHNSATPVPAPPAAAAPAAPPR